MDETIIISRVIKNEGMNELLGEPVEITPEELKMALKEWKIACDELNSCLGLLWSHPALPNNNEGFTPAPHLEALLKKLEEIL